MTYIGVLRQSCVRWTVVTIFYLLCAWIFAMASALSLYANGQHPNCLLLMLGIWLGLLLAMGICLLSYIINYNKIR